MSTLVIETERLVKRYGNKTAVADLTLQVPRGEVFGFLGPNGSGKSTSVKMLLGLVRPCSGSARILGQAPGHPPTMARVGFLPEHFRFHEWLQAGELLDLHGRLSGMDAATRRRRIPELLELVRLSEHARRPLSGFSKGMLQRIGLAQALLNHPDLVFLDEPTSALDPFGRMLVRNIIRDLKQQGTTIFLNSHLLGEVEATCDRVSFIREGRVLRTLVLSDFHAERLTVEVCVDSASPELLAALEELAGSGVARVPPAPTPFASTPFHPPSANVTRLELTLRDEALLPSIAEQVLARGSRLYALVPRPTSLEQLFLEVVGTEDSGQ
ncbi:MAG: ABC transporter ATP-binding protein [Chloroflexaceae bacterium]|nr:ABC transporter ATP-binding protein [Chloroflexaceae bacterium]